MSYDFSVPVQAPGLYVFLAVNRTPPKQGSVLLTLAAATKVAEVVTSTAYSTSYPLFTTTVTLPTSTVMQVPAAVNQNIIVAATVGLVALGAMAAFFMMRRRKP